MDRFRVPKALEMFMISAGFVLPMLIVVSGVIGRDRGCEPCDESGKRQNTSSRHLRAESSLSPQCNASGKIEITIICHYTASPVASPRRDKDPRIVLNETFLSFKRGNESYMRVELTFTNEGTDLISDGRPVYIAVDDDSGRNYVRRLLPHIDFRSLRPAVRQKFSERFLIPALQPGDYTIHLWIPSAVPNLKFDCSHNLLLSSVGVADQETGLNIIARFAIVR